MSALGGSVNLGQTRDAADKAMLDRFNVNLDISGSLGEGSGSGVHTMNPRRATQQPGSSLKGRGHANADVSHSMDSGDFHVSASESQMSRISGRGRAPYGEKKQRQAKPSSQSKA